MADNCTLFIKQLDFQSCLTTIETVARGVVRVIGTRGEWSSIELDGNDSPLIFYANRRLAPMDENARAILAAYNYARQIDSDHKVVKAKLLKRLSVTKAMIGVRKASGFSETDGDFNCVWTLAAATDAVIFNGSDFLDCTGRMWLGSDGSSEM